MAAEIRRATEAILAACSSSPEGCTARPLKPCLAASAAVVDTRSAPAVERGIALTPYSYVQLDSLKGYESGMPNPGFYHQVWEDGPRG